jgi:branched-chain amino acid aminotransferase
MSWVYLDGKFVPAEEAAVSVYDHGLLYGDGVFEGIRAYNGRVFRLEEHVKRLYDSAKAIMLDIPMTQEEMCDAILATLRKNGLTDAYIRPLVTRGVGDLGLDPRKCAKPTVMVISQKWDAMYGDLYEVGLTAVTVTVRRNSSAALPPNIKSLNYLNNILAKIEANVKGGNEAIFLDDAGNVSEGSGDNIFVVKDGKIFTPHTLNTADEIFVTGTAAEVAPVTKIDGRVISGGKPGPVTRDLIAGFKEMTLTTGTPI